MILLDTYAIAHLPTSNIKDNRRIGRFPYCFYLEIQHLKISYRFITSPALKKYLKHILQVLLAHTLQHLRQC